MSKLGKEKKKLFLAFVCLVGIMGVTACSDPKAAENGVKESSYVAPKKDKSAVETELTGDDDASTENTDMAEGTKESASGKQDTFEQLFANADLEGNVMELSDTEISLSIAEIETDEKGGETMIMAAPGETDESELTHVVYGDNMTVWLLTMDRASESQISLEDASSSDIKKQSSVMVFGTCQDTYHWKADKIVIVKWQ